jgi:hypothetical protein
MISLRSDSAKAKLSKALWQASRDKAGKTLSNVSGYAKEVGDSLLSKVGIRKSKGTALTAEMDTGLDTTPDPSCLGNGK